MSLDTNKTYLEWNGTSFPNAEKANFRAPAGTTIDWGDGTIENFSTESPSVNTHAYTDGKTKHIIAITGLTIIDEYWFNTCDGLIGLKLGNIVDTIRQYAFCSCNGLTSVTIPDSITDIREYAFSECRNLKSVTIGNSVTEIRGDAFSECPNLKSVIIGDSVTSIGAWVFNNCINLRSIVLFPSAPPTLGQRAIPTTISKIYVQQSSEEEYKANQDWNAFMNNIESNNTYLSLIRFNIKNKEYIDERIVYLINITS